MRLRFSIAALLFQTTLLNNKFHIYALVVLGQERGRDVVNEILPDVVRRFFFRRKPDRGNKRKSYLSIFRYVWLCVLFQNN